MTAAVLCLAGGGLVLAVLVEVFEALVLPRRVVRPFRLTRAYYRAAWAAWAGAGRLLPPGKWREALLGVFGPLSLLALFGVWAALLILGFGVLHYALDDPLPFPDALYLSGTTFTTLGYGDVNPTGQAERVLAVIEGMTGFGFVAVVIGYLPVLYQAFSDREAFIATLDARAGSHPSAGRLLTRFPPGPAAAPVLDKFLADAERWAAAVLESHLSFPVLSYYRSQHDNQSWLSALTFVLDSAALLLTVAPGADRGQARLTFAMARHTIVDLGLVIRERPEPPKTDRLADARLDELVAALRAAGVPARDDPAARAKLAELRALYEPFAFGLAAHFRVFLPAVWPRDERPDNWQTSPWAGPAGPLAALAADPAGGRPG